MFSGGRLRPVRRYAYGTACIALVCGAVWAQQTETKLPQDRGRAGFEQMLMKLRTTGRLMQTTAHPDDEDGGMLAYEARGKGADVLLLTLTRGDGGQNKTGSNLFDELGVLRTLELLESGRYYGVEQRFTRVADFGFTKSAGETLQKWDNGTPALEDMVRVIRTFRPDVVAARFQGKERDGHGQHQASGILTPKAVEAAADPNQFPEQIKQGLLPWQVKKLYMDNVRAGEEYNVRLDARSEFAPIATNFADFAMEGLHHQESQSTGGYKIPAGPSWRTYVLVKSALPNVKPGQQEQDFFDGIDTSLPGIAKRLGSEAQKIPSFEARLRTIAEQVEVAEKAGEKDILAAFSALNTGKTLTQSLEQELRSANMAQAAKSEVLALLEEKEQQFTEAMNLATGVEMEAALQNASSFHAVSPDSKFSVLAHIRNGGSVPVEPVGFRVDAPKGWNLSLHRLTVGPLSPGQIASARIDFTIPAKAQLTKPYWTRTDPETQNVYKIEVPNDASLPLEPAPVRVVGVYEYQGVKVPVSTVVRASATEIRRAMAVLPKFSLLYEHAEQVIPTAQQSGFDVPVDVTKDYFGKAQGKLKLQGPAGWEISPEQTVKFDEKVGKQTVTFHVQPKGVKEGRYELKASFRSEHRTYAEGFSVVGREDLDTFYYFQPSVQKVSGVDVQLPAKLKVGYIMGAGDDIPTVLKQLGINVSLIGTDELASGELSKYDTIVLGIRAYDTKEEVRAHNDRLLEFVKNGGTLLVQNNFSVDEFNKGNYAPYPATLSRDRVSVETAPVQVLAAGDAIFNSPNKIGPRDFQNWVQERGINFWSKWDDKYEPLLASSDPGEQPLKGGLLRAKYGKGTYIYTGYAFFRQLPAGVPGAVRLYVNLLSAGHE
jgi:LmbE family N-acetylglucosaminyl deacetylase